MKISRNIYIDSEAWESAQKLYPNQLSKMINEFLLNMSGVQEEEHNITEIIIEEEKINQQIRELRQTKAKINVIKKGIEAQKIAKDKLLREERLKRANMLMQQAKAIDDLGIRRRRPEL